jgi:hypothetical protein
MAFEALNQAGETEKNLIVVLNDNAMSISPNVGAFSSFLSRKMRGRRFRLSQEGAGEFSQVHSGRGRKHPDLFKKSEDSFITFFTPGMLFEASSSNTSAPSRGTAWITSLSLPERESPERACPAPRAHRERQGLRACGKGPGPLPRGGVF